MPTEPTNELHQALILDHFRRPRHQGPLPEPAATGTAHNPFCGDTVQIWVRVDGDRVEAAGFDGRGCAISQAAASMTTSLIVGKDLDTVDRLRQAFADGLAPGAGELPDRLGDLRALAGVRRFPSRIRCALLAFDAVQQALGDR